MAKIETFQEVALADLKPYENNAKIHDAEQVELIARSINEFGFLSPILIDKDKNIIAGHGRVEASKLLKLERVPAVFVEGLSEEQYRAYVLADNKLSELGSWNMEIVNAELESLMDADFEIDLTGFEIDMPSGSDASWFETRKRFDLSTEGQDEEYKEFLDKFEQKKTTDDCYTPDVVYEAVTKWVEEEYGISREKFVRPFYPGGDYEHEKYKKDCLVVDNPPFSILSEICKFYQEKKVRFFLFCPTVSAFSSVEGVCAVCLSTQVTYENGAVVNTSFLTNLEEGLKARTAPKLNDAILEANQITNRLFHREIPKYEYPAELVTSAQIAKYSKYGIDFRVRTEECQMVGELDDQKEQGKGIYGRGLLLSERKAKDNKDASEQADKKALEKNCKKKKVRMFGKLATANAK